MFIYNLKILPRSVIVCIALFFIFLSSLFGYLLRFNFSFENLFFDHFWSGVGLLVSCGFVSIMATSSYKGIIRYTGLQDGARIFYTVTLNAVLASLVNLIYFYNFKINILPYSVI